MVVAPNSDIASPLPAIDRRGLRERLTAALPGDFVLVLAAGHPLLKSADETYPFHAPRSYYYLTGLNEPEGVLVLARTGDRLEERLYLPEPNPARERWTGHMVTADEARAASGIADVRSLGEWRGWVLNRLVDAEDPILYVDLERRDVRQPPSPGLRLARAVARELPHVRIRNVKPLIDRLRRVKSPAEVARIRRAVECSVAGFAAIARVVRPGLYEYQLDAAFQAAVRDAGTVPGYPSIVASGPNATIMHYVALSRRIDEQDCIIVDAAAEWDQYKADITRTFPASGRFSERQQALYDIVEEARAATVDHVRPGTPHAELNRTTRSVLAQGLKALRLIHDDTELDRYYFYNVSHYLGLDTHDVGRYDVLEPGMVLTVEPGLYIDEWGIGIRLEDDVLVTEQGREVLSASLPTDRTAFLAWLAALRSEQGGETA
jgi:Xaa-Pro aminopeptidase